METFTSTIDEIDAGAIGRALARDTEAIATTEAANAQARVAEIDDHHRDVTRRACAELFVGLGVNVEGKIAAAAEAESRVLATVREARFDAKMRVGNIDSAGLETGGQVYVAPEYALANAHRGQAQEINDHEIRHLAHAHRVTDVSLTTGDPEADALLAVPPVAFPEADAMRVAGYRYTVDWYVTDYLEPVQAIARYVHNTPYEGGYINGPELVRYAAESGDVAKVRHAIVAAERHRRAPEMDLAA